MCYFMCYLTRRDNLSSYCSPGNVFFNISFRIPGLWVTEAWIFLYLKNFSCSIVIDTRPQTKICRLLTRDEIKVQELGCAKRGREYENNVAFLSWLPESVLENRTVVYSVVFICAAAPLHSWYHVDLHSNNRGGYISAALCCRFGLHLITLCQSNPPINQSIH